MSAAISNIRVFIVKVRILWRSCHRKKSICRFDSLYHSFVSWKVCNLLNFYISFPPLTGKEILCHFCVVLTTSLATAASTNSCFRLLSVLSLFFSLEIGCSSPYFLQFLNIIIISLFISLLSSISKNVRLGLIYQLVLQLFV